MKMPVYLLVGLFVFFFASACGDDRSTGADNRTESRSLNDESRSRENSSSSLGFSSGVLNKSSSSESTLSSSNPLETSDSKGGEAHLSSEMFVSGSSSSCVGSIYDAKSNTLTDLRDNQVYRTVTIGTQTWMAQNLNYEMANSFCYGNEASGCDTFGRFYTWAAAMDSVGTWSSSGKGCGYGAICLSPDTLIRGVCPENWHLPSYYEWKTLLTTVSGEWKETGKELMSKAGWNGYNGYVDISSDPLDFSVIPAGYEYGDGKYAGLGDNAYFWSWDGNKDYDAFEAIFINVNYDGNVYLSRKSKTYGYSIRCLMNVVDTPQSNSSSSSRDNVDPSTVISGTTTDDRDNHVYRTVTIGTQTWMAENLNFKTTSSYCYNDSVSYCSKYGRLYTWAAAMDSVGAWSDNGIRCGYRSACFPTYPVRGVCPQGWHLPSYSEWEVLLTAVGETKKLNSNHYIWTEAGTMLKSNSGWSDYKDVSGNGADAYLFSAYPAGYCGYMGVFDYDDAGVFTSFWTSTEWTSGGSALGNYNAYIMMLRNENSFASLQGSVKDVGYSVRCLKD